MIDDAFLEDYTTCGQQGEDVLPVKYLSLVLAHELERLMLHAFGDEDDDGDYFYQCEALVDAVRDRISELRGETVE